MARKNEPYIYKVLRRETPNPRQQAFFRAEAANIAYGGARGGGKSWAMRRKLVLLAMRYPGLKLLLLRRTLPELRANHILPLQRELAGYAAWSGAERAFRFPNGSRLVMGYCDSDSDCAQYQGQEYEVIGFEEATNFEPDWLTFIATCLRTTRTDFAPRIYYTCNPGGPGHAYIKRLFIDRAFHDGEDPADYVFIPAKVYDNQVLMQRDPGYLKRLEALPPARRRAHLEGDWNVYEGQVFAEWRDDPAHYADGKWTHVIEPFDIPNTWRVYRSFDFGYAKPFSVGWWAVDFDGRLYRHPRALRLRARRAGHRRALDAGSRSSSRSAPRRPRTPICAAGTSAAWPTPRSGTHRAATASPTLPTGTACTSSRATTSACPAGCRCTIGWRSTLPGCQCCMSSATAGTRGARCRCCATTHTRPRTWTRGRRTTSPTRSGICASPTPSRRGPWYNGRRKCSTR